MPVIELPEEPPLPGANTLFNPIFATMLYPRSDKHREHWFAAAMAGAYSWWRQEGASEEILSDFHGWVGILWELPLAPQRVYRDGMARVQRAALSGHLLMYLLRLARHHPQHCKVERAKALVSTFAPQEGQAVSESLIEKAWAEFKTASHLWAALGLAIHRDEAPGTENVEWLAFLGSAESIRRLAEEARILSPAETWKAPEGFALPPCDVEIAPLEAALLSFLDTNFPD